MNFNYSYRAFLITSLLFGILFLVLFGVQLKHKEKEKVASYDVEYADEELLSEEQEKTPVDKTEIETHSAFNEAEQFIKDIENDRIIETQDIEGKMQEMNEAIEKAATTSVEIIDKPKIHQELSNSRSDKENIAVKKANNRKTTIRWQLVNRQPLQIPNPVYTCQSHGKVVINIEVTATGRISKATYNKKASTTRNECLIESAIDYAKQSRFTTDADKLKQKGTITYTFPGQE